MSHQPLNSNVISSVKLLQATLQLDARIGPGAVVDLIHLMILALYKLFVCLPFSFPYTFFLTYLLSHSFTS